MKDRSVVKRPPPVCLRAHQSSLHSCLTQGVARRKRQMGRASRRDQASPPFLPAPPKSRIQVKRAVTRGEGKAVKNRRVKHSLPLQRAAGETFLLLRHFSATRESRRSVPKLPASGTDVPARAPVFAIVRVSFRISRPPAQCRSGPRGVRYSTRCPVKTIRD